MLDPDLGYGGGLYGVGLYGVGDFATTVEGVDYYAAWRVQMTLPIARTNLCTNPSFETNTSGWSAAGAPTPTIATTNVILAHSGVNSMVVTSTGSATFFPGVTFTLATTPGLDYIAAAWVWVPEGTPDVGIYLAGAQFGDTSSASNTWQRITLKFTATSSSSTIGLLCGFTATGQQFYVDDVLIFQGSYFADDLTLAVQAVEIDASTTTDLPDGSRFQVGYPAMQATVTLGGLIDPNDETKTAAWLFGRYSATSPMYRHDALAAPVTVDLGLYTDASNGIPMLLRKFTGEVDEYTVNDDGTVSFTCIDAIASVQRRD